MKVSRIFVFAALLAATIWAVQKKELSIQKIENAPGSSHASGEPSSTPLISKPPNVTAERPAKEQVLTDDIDQDLVRIENLSAIVLNKERKIKALRPLLVNPKLLIEIRSALSDSRTYDGKLFHRKLRLMDALYEGLNFPDTDVREKYISEATAIFLQPIPETYKEQPEWQRQFRADRVEVAMVLVKTMPETAERIRENAAGAADEFFSQGQKLKSLYDVAL